MPLGLLVPLSLLLSPLPFYENRKEIPQVEIRPETLEEKDLGVLVALPEHKIAESLHAASSYEEIQWWALSSVHVVVESLRCDGLGVLEGSWYILGG